MTIYRMDFLQSEEWRKFQEAVGRPTFSVDGINIIEHSLPIVGNYFYIPRGPVMKIPISKSQPCLPAGRFPNKSQNSNPKIQNFLSELLDLAKKEKAGWIRLDINNSDALDNIRKYSRVIKAPHDMQPREVFVVDIAKTEEELLAGMKVKTRYNIKLAEQKKVRVFAITNLNCHPGLDPGSNNLDSGSEAGMTKRCLDEFLRLVKLTAERNKITSHPEEYYRKMFEIIPPEIIKLYIAEYEGKVIAANIVVFYGDTATYLHGASDNEYRNVMAPYLLQWQAIQDAKKAGCVKYDFGGVKIAERSDLTPTLSLLRRGNKGEVNSWAGITKFKMGFSPNTKPVEFIGSYDMILSPVKYYLYRIIQKIKSIL